MKAIISFVISLPFGFASAQDALGEVVGNVLHEKTQKGIYNARVQIIDGDKRYQSSSSPEGRFRISAVPPGAYHLTIIFEGDTMRSTEVVQIPLDGIANAGDIVFTGKILELGPVIISAKKQAIKLEYGFLPVKSLSSEEIEKSPVKFDIKSLVSTMSTDVKLGEDGELVFRGARKGDMIYIVDGIKVQGDFTMPSVAIGRMMVYSGGLPAKYGDTMGGVVILESKSYFDLLRQEEGRLLRMGL